MTARRMLTALALAGVVAAGLLGGRAGGAPAAEPARARAAGRFDADWIRGAFWRPAGSVAERPALRFERVTWNPTGTTAAARE